ncbi:hypothetical protein KP509_17G044100 [Ceratopteris richardii]|uniref:NAC domain-containing protein n=1 Tax=Ceratopteris richardii TaxID=49495 RepID=A0A8T2SXT1_CERRI|nr:hypothetical protein KP509_17G044100 [Ceratopteris richardii]
MYENLSNSCHTLPISEACTSSKLGLNSNELPPGFRFQPTEEELIGFYLFRKAAGLSLPAHLIPEVDLHKHDPWDLPDLSPLPANTYQWFFFTFVDRKYQSGSRANRVTPSGYWKATGRPSVVVASATTSLLTDIQSSTSMDQMSSEQRESPSSNSSVSGRDNAIGTKKTLVFYAGRAPHGQRTPWVMHEFHLSPHLCSAPTNDSCSSEIVISRIVRKESSETHVVVPEG